MPTFASIIPDCRVLDHNRQAWDQRVADKASRRIDD
jgi:hypothetical protein